MPTILTHALVPITAGVVLGGRIARPVVVAGAVLAMLPDLDTAGLALGVAYGDDWGHRGATHSLIMAGVAAGLVALLWPPARNGRSFLFLFLSAASHGLLDMLTSGGLGVALLWPFETARYFAPWRPIRVSPIGAGFFSARGLRTLASEALWVWCPLLGMAIAACAVRRRGG